MLQCFRLGLHWMLAHFAQPQTSNCVANTVTRCRHYRVRAYRSGLLLYGGMRDCPVLRRCRRRRSEVVSLASNRACLLPTQLQLPSEFSRANLPLHHAAELVLWWLAAQEDMGHRNTSEAGGLGVRRCALRGRKCDTTASWQLLGDRSLLIKSLRAF
jgi:hypothetical protein